MNVGLRIFHFVEPQAHQAAFDDLRPNEALRVCDRLTHAVISQIGHPASSISLGISMETGSGKLRDGVGYILSIPCRYIYHIHDCHCALASLARLHSK